MAQEAAARLFNELTCKLWGKFEKKLLPDEVDIAGFGKEFFIIDVSRYEQNDSRLINIRHSKSKSIVTLHYNIPRAESSRKTDQNHQLIFTPSGDRSYSVQWSSDTFEGTQERTCSLDTACTLVCNLLQLPWDPKTMHA